MSDEKTVGIDPRKRAFPSELDGFLPVTFWRSAPTRFGSKYRDELEVSDRVYCYLNTNVVDIRLTENGDRVESIDAADYDGNRHSVIADNFVLAMGGIENPRILLNCTQQQPEGLGNQQDLVGRYFCEHLHFRIGAYVLEDNVKVGGKRRFFSPTPALMARDQILNFGLRFEPYRKRGLIDPSGFKERIRRLVCSSETLTWAAEGLGLNGYGTYDIDCGDGLLGIASEQAPNRDSRVTLGYDVDRLGLRRTSLHLKFSDIDVRTMRQAIIEFGKQLAMTGVGRVRVTDWLMADELALPSVKEDEVGGHHHMCTTRMALSAEEGVVDKDQRVFGIGNLYVAGSSVFSTVGHANPTLTIVQTSLRLADRLTNVSTRRHA